ncbi:MAG: ABC transporter ATP-binding protein [Cyclobacteriaceae bacterium]|nr:ABC transporter ATP-binding protein [Cyclobacteriaceae bacterium]
MIRVENISHSYGEVQALRDISFEVKKGQIFGLIGPDGAGKTTLIRILTTLILADQGTAFIDGMEVQKEYKKIRSQIGYMPGRFSLYEDLSILENLNLFAAIFGTTLDENYHLIEDIYKQIEPFKHRRAGQLSGGMKQKLALSCAMIHAPNVIFLDEPTTGVDPVSRKEFWQMLKTLKERGITILVSTPYMDEAAMCSEVALIHDGQFLDIDTPEKIISKYKPLLYRAKSSKNNALLKEIRNSGWTKSAYLNGEFVHFTVEDLNDVNKIRVFIQKQEIEIMEFKEVNPSIEDCFMDLMHSPTE